MDLKKIVTTNKLVVIYFWGQNCKGCVEYAPIFEQVEKELKDTATFVKIDITDQKVRSEMDRFLSGKANEKVIQGKPTTVLFKDGKSVKAEMGKLSAAFLKNWITQ
jgi:thiol-disulfide isomerase/thioredoxin